MPQAECLRSHAARCRDLAQLADYPLTATALLEQAEEYEALARKLEKDPTLH